MISKKFIQKKVYFMQGIFLCSLLFVIFSSMTDTASADCSCTGGSSLGSSDKSVVSISNAASGAAACQPVCTKAGYASATDAQPSPTTTINQINSGAASDPTPSGQATNTTATPTNPTNPANPASGANAPAGTASTTFPNPLGSVTTVSALLSSIMTNLMGVLAIISLIFIILGGIMYMLSAGNEEMITRAKKTWTGAVIGLAIAMAAPTFLKEIRNILGGNNTSTGNADSWVSNALTIQQIATNVLNLLLSIVGIIAMIAMVIGGLMYLTAAGDERRIDKGKDIFKYAVIGVIVTLSALVIIRQVNTLLGG